MRSFYTRKGINSYSHTDSLPASSKHSMSTDSHAQGVRIGAPFSRGTRQRRCEMRRGYSTTWPRTQPAARLPVLFFWGVESAVGARHM